MRHDPSRQITPEERKLCARLYRNLATQIRVHQIKGHALRAGTASLLREAFTNLRDAAKIAESST